MSEPESTTDVNRRCTRCGAAVTRQFVRVFGASNRVHGCLDCLTRQRLADGDAAKRVGGDQVGSDWR
jgi:hypothetical protein